MYFGNKITAALKVALCGFIRDSFDLFRGMVFDETFFFYNCESRRLLGQMYFGKKTAAAKKCFSAILYAICCFIEQSERP